MSGNLPENLNILIADDHWVVRSATRALIEQDCGARVLEASNVDEAMEIISSRNDLDLILLDLHMPGRPPLELLRAARNAAADTPIAILTVSEERSDVLRSLEHGAVGYIPKTAEPEVILATIASVLKGEVALPQRLLQNQRSDGPGALGAEDEFSQIADACRSLTRRQLQVFELLASGATNQDIARELGVSTNTVRVHLQAISSRLPANSRSQLALFASKWVQRSNAH
ncbi:MAG: response regulator transcription factor [Pseudomonadota bacterium]